MLFPSSPVLVSKLYILFLFLVVSLTFLTLRWKFPFPAKANLYVYPPAELKQKQAILRLSVLTSITNSAFLFSGLALFMTWQGGHFWCHASCSWWRPGLHHWSLSVLLTSTGYRLQAWPQALCVQLGCVPASWLSHKASAPTPGQGFLPISFLQREPYFRSTQNSLVHVCVIGMSLLTIFFPSLSLWEGNGAS